MWSKVLTTENGILIKSGIVNNSKCSGLAYHNFDHVNAMYNYLESINEPYDEALDWAILFHDFIYDAEPNKEQRSAEAWKEFAIMKDLSNVDLTYDLIMATKDHVLLEDNSLKSAIIKADLCGLSNPVTTINNYMAIMTESKNLYGINEREFARNNLHYMKNLLKTVCLNSCNPKDNDFYQLVKTGIQTTMFISLKILNKDVDIGFDI